MKYQDNLYGDLIEPPAVRFSFDAPGWYVVTALLIIAAMLGLIRYKKYRERNSYRREALRALDLLLKEPGATDTRWFLYRLARLLKAVAMSVYGKNVATLRRNEYISFLNLTWEENSFTNTDGQLLCDVPYNKNYEVMPARREALTAKIKQWFTKHHHAVRNST